LIADTVPEERVGQTMAYASSALSIGLILGPVLGGVLYARCGYYAAFGLAFGFIGLDLILRVFLVEKKIAVRYLAAPSTANVESRSIKMQDLSESAVPAPTDPTSQAELPSSSVLTTRRSKIPTVIRILKYPRLLVALFLSFVQALILSAFDATLPLYLNALFNYSALQSGS
jgi:MFS family permease